MIREINVQELAGLPKTVLVDVRSEGEFTEATIPGAVNLPLLDNAERIEVGRTFTQVSPAQARELGLRLVSPKLPTLVERAERLQEEGSLVLFCWRGGMRSKAFAQVLDLMGLPVFRLVGGYKAYRRQVLDFFAQELPFHVVVLRGNTGIGKTELLAELRAKGYPAVDLERLANNRGSVFGDIGLGAAPSQKDFEAALYSELQTFKNGSYLIVECESKRIGRVALPTSFYNAMQNGTQILLYDSIKNRVKRLLEEYMRVPGASLQIREALQRLIKILGHEKVQQLNCLLDENKEEFTERLLEDYYDPLYAYPNEPSTEYILSLDNTDHAVTVRELERYLDEHMGTSQHRSTLSGVRNPTE
ncbi:MAG: tRNA 2-selenouridine(34) synthase MnmH [Desulfitobacteriaceae bacterium]